MKFIRQIVIGLALLAVFVIFSIFSIKEYSEDKINLSSNEDKLPGVSTVLSYISSFLKMADKIPVPNFLSVEDKIGAVEDIYNDANNIIKNGSAVKIDNFTELASITPETIRSTNWQDFFRRIKEALSKDWSQF